MAYLFKRGFKHPKYHPRFHIFPAKKIPGNVDVHHFKPESEGMSLISADKIKTTSEEQGGQNYEKYCQIISSFSHFLVQIVAGIFP